MVTMPLVNDHMPVSVGKGVFACMEVVSKQVSWSGPALAMVWAFAMTGKVENAKRITNCCARMLMGT